MERIVWLDWPVLVKEAVTRRKQQKITQETLALFLGLSKPMLNRFEQGYTALIVANALKIFHSLGMPLNWQEIVDRSIQCRKQQKLTQETLAFQAKVSKPMLNHFERGRTNITLNSVLKILKCLQSGLPE